MDQLDFSMCNGGYDSLFRRFFRDFSRKGAPGLFSDLPHFAVCPCHLDIHKKGPGKPVKKKPNQSLQPTRTCGPRG